MTETLFSMAPAEPAEPGSRSVALASAGTGKTFQLTNRLIGLLAAGEAPETVLATTFTRAAAGEILHRLLARLAAGALRPGALEELREHADPSLTQDRCRGLLVEVARKLHRLNIGTLDAFFYQMASSYALELGLGPSWRLMDDPEDAALRLEALDVALERAHTAHGEELASLFRLLHDGDPGRAVADRLLRAVKEAYGLFLDAPAEAWERVRPQNRPLGEAELEAAIEALADVELPLTQAGTENRSWAKAFAALESCARAGQWEEFVVKSTLVQRILDDEPLFGRLEIEEEHRRAIEPLIRHAEAVIVGRLAERNRATRELLAHFDAAYRGLKAARGRYRFDDLPRLLRVVLETGDLEELYYRLDGRVRHLLLDEFQDTSIPQFRLLKPMLDELLLQEGQGRTVYIVGDQKQSLYSWRSAEPRLLGSLAQHYKALEPQFLSENWRSSQVILDVVNRVFSGLGANPALSEHAEVACAFAGDFREHIAARDLPGAVNIVGVGPLEREDDPFEVCDEVAADTIEAIVREAPGATVGVLVRVRKRIAPLLEALRRRGVDASEEGGSPLTDTPAAAATLALLTLADHPDHVAAAMRVATSPLGRLVSLRDPTDRLARRRAAAVVRRRIDRDGYGDTFDWIMREVAQQTDARGVARMGQLVALGDQLDHSPPVRIADAARALAELRMADPRESRVRLMTIHASKGLQFDAVALPDLSESLKGRGGGTLVDQPHPMEPPVGASCNVREGLRKLHPQLQELAARDEQRRVREGLCLLYVAMTRAKRRLDMIVKLDKDGSSASSPTADRVLLAEFPLDAGRVDPKRAPHQPALIRSLRSGVWSAGLGQVVERAAAAPIATRLEARQRPAWRLARRSPSRRDDGVARALRPAGGAMEAGRLVHAWLERIGWIEDGLPEDAALLALAAARGWSADDAAARLASLHQAIESPALRELLGREATAARASAALRGAGGAGAMDGLELELRREWPFVLREDDALVTGQVDRLVIGRCGGRAVWAEVIDFKTDITTRQAPDRAAILDRHADQMRAYRAAVCRALGLPPEQVPVALALLGLGVVGRV